MNTTVDLKISKADIVDILLNDKRKELEQQMKEQVGKINLFTQTCLRSNAEVIRSMLGGNEIVFQIDDYKWKGYLKGRPDIRISVELTEEQDTEYKALEKERRAISSLIYKLEPHSVEFKAIRTELLESIIASSTEGAEILKTVKKIKVPFPRTNQ
jgi:hypothetical protein